MGKSRRAFKEHTKEQELTHENKTLKTEIARLTKLLSKYSLDKSDQEDRAVEKRAPDKDQLSKLKEQWRCTGTPGCSGHLEIFIFNKIDKEFYFRKCNSCNYRTRSQKYNSDVVTGIIKKTS